MTARRSCSSEPSTFWARTCAPSRTGSTQTRTFGTPSTCIMQFGQLPEQQSKPRGRWYLKLREKTRRPAAKSAEPMVSPAKLSTGVPSKKNVPCRARSRCSCGCGGSPIRRRACRGGSPRRAPVPPPSSRLADRPGALRSCACRARRGTIARSRSGGTTTLAASLPRCAGSGRTTRAPAERATRAAAGSPRPRTRTRSRHVDRSWDRAAETTSAAGDSGNPVRPRERDTRHRRRLDRERDEVLRLEVVDVGLAARARERLRLESQHTQVVRDPAAADDRVEARGELGILSRDADGIATGLPVVVKAGRTADPLVFLVELGTVVAHRDQRGRSDRDGVGA